MISAHNYKNFTDVANSAEMKYVENTIANLGKKHFELLNKKTNRPFLVELHPMPLRYVNASDKEKAGKFEPTELSKHKWNFRFKEGIPECLSNLSDAVKEKIVDGQKESISVLQDLDKFVIRTMYDNDTVLKKQKAKNKKMLAKHGAEGDDLDRMAWEMFLEQAQTGLAANDDSETFDIKMKASSYYRSKDGTGLELRYPRIMRNDGVQSVIDLANPDNEIFPGALVTPLARVKPYVTPNGAYGTTYQFYSGVMIKNGTKYDSGTTFTSYSFGTEDEQGYEQSEGEPSPKRRKA